MGVPYAEVIGDPITHSKSPLIHKFWLEKLGIAGDYRRCRVGPEELARYLESRKSDLDWRGSNVTMPLKQDAIAYCADHDDVAARTGAVNTIVASGDGKARGFNTDVRAVATLLPPYSKRAYPNHVATYVQIVGAGGAARAAAIGAIQAGYGDIDVFNRSVAKAEELALWLGFPPDGHAAPLEQLMPIRNPGDGPEEQRYSHVLINASSLGMTGNPDLQVDLSLYYPDTIVIDLVYGDGETALVRQAKALGLRTVDGLQILVEQAAAAFELFFQTAAPRHLDGALRQLLTR